MANLSNVNDLKLEVLRKAGELTDGTSPYDSATVEYLDQIHKSIIAGGVEFGVDINDPWVWAKAAKNIVINLQPPYSDGTVTLTNGSASGSFSSAPAASQKGRYLKIESRDEYFLIVKHTAGDTVFVLDKGYTEASGSFNFKSIPLEYEVIDDTIVIDSTNKHIDFTDGSGSYSTSVTEASYSPSALATELETVMDAAATDDISVSYDSDTRKFTIATAGTTLTISFGSGTNAKKSLAKPLGFADEDLSGSLSYVSELSLNAIERFIHPFLVYRQVENGWAGPNEDGKVFALDEVSFFREFPLTELKAGTPNRFCEVRRSTNGIVTIRFNRYVEQETRLEIPYIPIPRSLKDSSTSVPLIPLAFRNLLVFGATYYIQLDKSDDKAQTNFQLAAAKLRGLQSWNRKPLQLAGNNYAKLIPRRGYLNRRKRLFID